MANTDPVEWILYSSDLVTELGILPVIQGHIYLEFQEPGSGEVRIPLDSPIASSVSNGQFIKCLYRGSARAAFFVDNIKEIDADQGEGAGRMLSISGQGALAILNDAIVWDDGSGASTRSFTGQKKAYILKTLIDEAVARGALATLDYDFTATDDSSSVAWTDSEDYDINVGQNLLDVLRLFAETGDMEFTVTLQGGSQPILLSAYKNGTGTDRSSTIFMRIGSNCEEVTRDERGDELKNVYLIKFKDGYAAVSDATSISTRRRREEFLSLEAAQSGSSATTYGSAKLDLTKDPKQSISVRVYDGVAPYLFVDYVMGDTVTLDKFGTQLAKRVLGIQADFDGDHFAQVVLELNIILYDNELRTKHQLDWLLHQWDTAKDANLLEVRQWMPVGQPNNQVYALHTYGNYLYIGGDFTQIGTLPYGYIVKLDITTGTFSSMGSIGAPVIGISDRSGTIYAATDNAVFEWSGSAWVQVGEVDTPASESITSLYSSGSILYVTGNFAGIESVPMSESIGAYNGSWSAVNNSTAAPGTCLQVIEFNSKLYAAYNHTGAGLYEYSGGTWSSLFFATGKTVMALAVVGSYLAFLEYGLNTKLYLWDGVAASPTLIGSGLTGGGDPIGQTWVLGSNLSDLYIGDVNQTTETGSALFHFIARYSGGMWSGLGDGLDISGNVRAIEADGDDVYVGGTFATAGGQAITNLAVWVTTFESLVTHLNSSTFNLGAAIHGATAITTPTNNDEFPLWEDTSQDLRKVTWSNIKATLKTYFDTLYGLLASANIWLAQQQIKPTGNGALYLETHGDNYTLDTQQASNTEEVTTNLFYMFRHAITNDITGNMIEALITEESGGTMTGGLIHIEDDSGPIFDVLRDGSIRLPHLADSAAANDSWYYSTDGSKPAYKDGGGTAHYLY